MITQLLFGNVDLGFNATSYVRSKVGRYIQIKDPGDDALSLICFYFLRSFA